MNLGVRLKYGRVYDRVSKGVCGLFVGFLCLLFFMEIKCDCVN